MLAAGTQPTRDDMELQPGYGLVALLGQIFLTAVYTRAEKQYLGW